MPKGLLVPSRLRFFTVVSPGFSGGLMMSWGLFHVLDICLVLNLKLSYSSADFERKNDSSKTGCVEDTFKTTFKFIWRWRIPSYSFPVSQKAWEAAGFAGSLRFWVPIVGYWNFPMDSVAPRPAVATSPWDAFPTRSVAVMRSLGFNKFRLEENGYMGVCINWGTPRAGWFRKSRTKIDDLGAPLF